jgi:hypothetical protein
MKTFKDKTVQEIDSVYCDVCGLNCTIEQFGSEYATLEALWGYNSTRDGQKFDIQICESCFTDTLNWMKQKRKLILGCFHFPHNIDPLNGIS